MLAAALIRWRALGGVIDVDTDAYGHAIVARRMLERPLDLSVHWVWLPLWHAVHALFTLVGLGFSGVRALSMLASLATVALVFVCTNQELAVDGPAPRALVGASVAASAVAFAPNAVESAVSAEPEATFALLVFGAIASVRAARPWLAGALLSLAALLRYEAWPLVAALALADGALRLRRRGQGHTPAWLLPASVVALWCIVHRAHAGSWLWFIRENRAFVARALPRLLPVLPPLFKRVLWYPVTLPWINWGAIAVAACAVGFAQLGRARRWPWLLAPAALVGFVSYAWIRGQHLGLVRHAVAFLPFYALAMGAGASSAIERTVDRLRAPNIRWWLVFVCVAWMAPRALHSTQLVRERAERSLRDERSAAAVLAREATEADLVYCDNAVVEVLSGLRRSQFVRWSAADIRPANLHVEQRTHRAVWVVANPAHTAAIRSSCELRAPGERVVLLRALPR